MFGCKENSNLLPSQLYYSYDYATHSAIVIKTPNDYPEDGSIGLGYSDYSGDIIIPSSVVYNGEKYEVLGIGMGAFAGCKNLRSITIPRSIINIEKLALTGSLNLEAIVVDSKNPEYDSRYNCNAIIETETSTLIYGCNATIIPNDILTIGTESFECLTFESMPIPEGVKRIEHHTLWRLPYLRSIEIPNSVVFIGENVLSYCENLSSVILGKSLEQIDADVLRDNPNLVEVTCYAVNPPKCNGYSRPFSGISNEAILYVPAQSVSRYTEDNVWGKAFKEIHPITTN